MSHAQASRQESQKIGSDWLARILGRRIVRWGVVIFWLAVIAVFSGFGNALSQVTDDSSSAYLPSSAPSTRVVNLEEQAQLSAGKPDSDQAIVVITRASGRLTAADLALALPLA